MSFQFHALPADQFSSLFKFSDDELANIRARRMTVKSASGYPCRVSLKEANIGEAVMLLNFEHQPVSSPYKSSHAIFVRKNAEQAFPEIGEVPEIFDRRIISLRAFDGKHDLIDADLMNGSGLSEAILTIFKNNEVRYLHLHNAKPGCFLCRVTRV
jgi:hypothetical protein